MTKKEFETGAIHNHVTPDPSTGATKTPIFQSAGFAYDSAKELEDVFNGRQFGYYYSRVSNPSVTSLEQRIAALDGSIGATVVGSGMAAISNTILTLASSGDSVICGSSLFGSTFYLLKGLITQCGINVHFVDPTDIEEIASKIDDTTRLIFVEAIGNPKCDIPNLEELSKCAKQHNIPLVVDNTFVTPYLMDAKKLGVHVVVTATTKYLCGGGSTLGGAITDTGTFDWSSSKSSLVKEQSAFGPLAFLSAVRKVRSNLGSCQSPFNAFLTAEGLETLVLRMDKHCQNATLLATFLSEHPEVDSVNYPGLKSHAQYDLAKQQYAGKCSGMLTIRLGSKERAFALIDHLKLVKNLVNLGDSKTLAVYPATTIYRNLSEEEREKAGVYGDLLRISVGLEHSKDIIEDFEQALAKLKRG